MDACSAALMVDLKVAMKVAWSEKMTADTMDACSVAPMVDLKVVMRVASTDASMVV